MPFFIIKKLVCDVRDQEGSITPGATKTNLAIMHPWRDDNTIAIVCRDRANGTNGERLNQIGRNP